MLRRLLFAALCYTGIAPQAAAQQQQCIDLTAMWTVPYPQGEIQAATYYVWQQQSFPRYPLLAVLYRSGEFHIHINVPQSVAQRFTGLTSADQTYTQFVRNSYQQTLISEANCPLLNENGTTYLLAERP